MCGVLQVPLTDNMLCCFGQSPKQENRPVGDIYTHTCPPRILANTHTHTHTSMRECESMCACVCVFVCVHTFGAQSVVNGGNFTK